ncbi:MAG TPA: response regulator [Chthoniobacter sp.]|jgi:PAS domain S-box-containing protein
MKFLHLEDDDADAELFQMLLRREWPECRIKRIWSLAEFEAALRLEDYQLILSDHSMVGFDGLKALEIARVSSPDTPFIFLSGTIGEERAIAALKKGAVDYVLKSSPARLVSAVRGALGDAERETARRRAEESLRKNREQFQQISENIDNFIVLLDAYGHCLYANPAFYRLHESSSQSSAKTIFDHVHREDATAFQCIFREVVQTGQSWNIEYRLPRPGGQVSSIEAHVSRLQHRGSETPSFLLTGRDITERKQAEQVLLEQASLLGNARDAILLFDLEFVIRQWNASAERIFARAASQAIRQDIRKLLFSSQLNRFDAAFALTMAHGEWHGDFHLSQPDGRDIIVETSWSLVNDPAGRPKSVLCISTDVTSRKQLELKLQRAQRLDALGMLAGGIAHDLNNILSPILMSVGLLRPLAQDEDHRLVLDTLETSATHGAELVQQILLFARGEEGKRAKIRISELLDELKSVLKTAVRQKIDLTVEHSGNLWPVSADATQMKQVLLNLCMNSRDAMPNGGSIRISAANVLAAAGDLHCFHGEVPPGAYVRLSVTDNGTGIPPELLEKIFDPFFTTKDVGKGTGLGLSTIAGIVRSHEGYIQVESIVGQGTSFRIYLPSGENNGVESVAPPSSSFLDGHGEFILIIDDDEGIRYVTERILKAHGYEVFVAIDGQSGLDLFVRLQDRIQLVICDQMMPGLKGAEVLTRIEKEHPDVKLIAMSGFLEDHSADDARIGTSVVRLTKPLRTEVLLRTIRQLLDGAVPVAASQEVSRA